MAHLFQVGVGSIGMAVLDQLGRDERINRVTLVDCGIYEADHLKTHLFGSSGIGQFKVDLAEEWLRSRRPSLPVDVIRCDVTDPSLLSTLHQIVDSVGLGVCATDDERTRCYFDEIMTRRAVPWTTAEIAEDGAGGWIHAIASEGPCYRCVSAHVRELPDWMVTVPTYTTPDACTAEGLDKPAQPGASGHASAQAVASLQALISLELLGARPSFTSLYLPLVGGTAGHSEMYQASRYRVEVDLKCSACRERAVKSAAGDKVASVSRLVKV